MFQGDYHELLIQVTGPNDSIVDSNGIELEFIVAANAAGPALVTKTRDNGITVTVDATGHLVAEVVLLPADTANLEAKQHYLEMEIRDAEGKPFTVFTGTLQIKAVVIK